MAKTFDGRHQLLIREKRSDPTLTTLSSRGPLLLEREREPFKIHYSMIEVQYFYRSSEALLVKIVFTENWLFKNKFLEKVGGANAPPAPPPMNVYM